MIQVHPELRKVVGDLELAQEAKDLLLAALIDQGETLATNNALELLWLLRSLRSGGIQGLIALQKMQLLENLVDLMRQRQKEWISRVCNILYEDPRPPQHTSSLLPEGMIVDLLRWVNIDKSEKVRESLWGILLRKDMGLASIAKVSDVAAGLFERDPITRNNVIRFLFDHFHPNEVVESLFQYSMASGKRIPGVVFKRYASLLKDQEDQQQKKYILEKILSTAKLDDKEIDQIFSDYMNSLNRFDLIRLLSSSDGSPLRISDLKRKGAQIGFPFDHRMTSSPHHDHFRQRVSLLMQM